MTHKWHSQLLPSAVEAIGQTPLVELVRIICATSKDLPQEIAKGNFRQDLYYRLNVISIQLPPLRQQREDIPMLFRIFHERVCQRLGVEPARVDPEVLRRLQQHEWPGNMRESARAMGLSRTSLYRKLAAGDPRDSR